MKCHNQSCRREATHGVRCEHHRDLHRRSNRNLWRRTYKFIQEGTPMPSYAPRKCSRCGSPGHDRRLCGRIESEPEVWLFV